MYIRKAAELFGVTRTREIYEKAIEMLPDSDAAAICTQYAQLEVQFAVSQSKTPMQEISNERDGKAATWNSSHEQSVLDDRLICVVERPAMRCNLCQAHSVRHQVYRKALPPHAHSPLVGMSFFVIAD